MNRTPVIFLALAILLTHTLAIHQTPSGDFAAPYDSAHVAYRLGRNLVHFGVLNWNPQGAACEAYPSFSWILVAAVADALQAFPTTVAQTLGILSALLTIIVLAQFSPSRIVGLTAPVLLACSGAAAAASASGTEAASAMLFVTVSFLSYERGWVRMLSVALCLLLITRPEGCLLLWIFMLMELLDKSRDHGFIRRPMWRAFVLPLCVVAIGFCVRQWAFGHWLSPTARAALSFDAERLRLGRDYAASFFLSSGSAPLLLMPLVLSLGTWLKGRGRRALLLFLGWMGYVVLTGGDGLPFWNAQVPTLPLAFLAVQGSFTHWLDRYERMAPLAWCTIVGAMLASLLVSKVPGDFGPIPLGHTLRSWMRPSASSSESFPHALGREGLLQELRHVHRMRTTGLFFAGENKTLGDARVATLWPGSLGYLSRLTVIDILGRTTPQGDRASLDWRGQPRVDLVAALEAPSEYLVLDTDEDSSLSIAQRFHNWLSRYDLIGDTPERFRELLKCLIRFELVSVPVPLLSADPSVLSARPFLLMRRRNLNLAPEIIIRRSGRRFNVLIAHQGHRQVADLVIRLLDQDQVQWTLAPNGTWDLNGELRARSNNLVYDTGERPFEILSASFPREFTRGTLEAHLLSPGSHVGSILESNFKSIEIELE